MAMTLGVEVHSRERKLLFTLCLAHTQEHMENTGCQIGRGPEKVL